MNDQKRAISLAVLKKGKTIASGRFPGLRPPQAKLTGK